MGQGLQLVLSQNRRKAPVYESIRALQVLSEGKSVREYDEAVFREGNG